MDILEQVKFWLNCLNPKTFKEVMAKDKGKGDLIEASKNILISSIIMAIPMGLVLIVLGLLMGSKLPSYFGLPFAALAVLYVIIMVIVAPISFLIIQGVYWVLAKLLGGKGEYRQQAYLASLFTAGVYLISILCIVPCLGSIVSIALMMLLIYLEYLLISNVHKLGSAKAALVVLAPILLFIVMYIALLLYLTPVMVAGSAPVPVPVQVN
jgi:hypothetical protein